MIKVGIFGTGRIGKIHIKNLINHPKVDLKMVVDPFIDEDFIKALGISFSKDEKDIFENPQIDTVFICTPSDTHYDLIKKSILAHKIIFCEKPIDLDLKRILEIKQLVEKENVFLQVGFNRRFDSNFRKIAKEIQEGAVGKLVQTRITSRDFSPPPRNYVEASGGMFLDMSIHDFDMLRFITKKEVQSIFVNATNLVTDYGDIDVDTAFLLFTLMDGSLASIENCRSAVYGYDQRIEVLGKDGRIFCDNKYDNSVILCNKENESRENPLDFFLERYRDSYKNELEDFIFNVQNNNPPSVGIDESIEATILALAALQSHQQKQMIEIASIKAKYAL